MAKDKQELVWVEFDMSDAPSALQKLISEAQDLDEKARVKKEAARKMLEKHYIDSKVVEANQNVLLGFNKFNKKISVATTERKQKKPSGPVIGWGGFKK